MIELDRCAKRGEMWGHAMSVKSGEMVTFGLGFPIV